MPKEKPKEKPPVIAAEIRDTAMDALIELTDLPWKLADVHMYPGASNGETMRCITCNWQEMEANPEKLERFNHLAEFSGVERTINTEVSWKAQAGLKPKDKEVLTILGYDIRKLLDLQKVEAGRREQAPEIASLLSRLTGFDWKWNGSEVRLQVKKGETFPRDKFYELRTELQPFGVRIEPFTNSAVVSVADTSDLTKLYDLDKLREAVRASDEEREKRQKRWTEDVKIDGTGPFPSQRGL